MAALVTPSASSSFVSLPTIIDTLYLAFSILFSLRAFSTFVLSSAFVLKLDAKNAWRVFKRDRYKSTSPNSGQTETVCAGALGIELLGDYKNPSIAPPNNI